MTEVIYGERCGNAPKQAFLKEFHTALAVKDISFVLENITDDVRWHLVGERLVQGKTEVAGALEQLRDEEAVTLTLDKIITHGDMAAVEGATELASGKTFAFCDVYLFNKHGKNAKIKERISFAIELDR